MYKAFILYLSYVFKNIQYIYINVCIYLYIYKCIYMYVSVCTRACTHICI